MRARRRATSRRSPAGLHRAPAADRAQRLRGRREAAQRDKGHSAAVDVEPSARRKGSTEPVRGGGTISLRPDTIGRVIARIWLLVTAALMLPACSGAWARVVTFDSSLSPRPDSCAIDYEHSVPKDWREIGVVCLSPHSSFQDSLTIDAVYAPGTIRDSLRTSACAMGGDAVAPFGVCMNAKLEGIEFAVLRRP